MVNFDKLQVAKVYNKARPLTKESFDLWKREILRFVPQRAVKVVLDLGCGTGKFAKLLRDTFNARVTGIDPAKSMIKEAKKLKLKRIRFFVGAAEDIKLKDGAVDLVFLSMVYHNLKSINLALREIFRVLRKGGFLVIRQATDVTIKLDHLPFKHFPESQRVAFQLVKTSEEIRSQVENFGFKAIGYRTVKNLVASNYRDYYNSISLRSATIFRFIPDNVWHQRLRAFKKFCHSPHRKGKIYEHRDLFVFQKKN